MLHGRGADERDLAVLSPRLDARLLIVSVRAPYAFQYGGYTWYDVRAVGVPEDNMFQKSYTRLVKFSEVLPQLYAVDPAQVFLMGFSMGAVMAYALSLTLPEKIAGVIAHSGYVPESSGLTLRWKQLAAFPFFVAHGTRDEVIPLSFGRRARELLQAAEADLTYHEYPIGHQISQQSLNDLSMWLSQHIRGEGS